MNPFFERYKAYSNTDLLRILENQSDYQAEAITAAQFEISERNLSAHEFNEAKEELQLEKEQRELKKLKENEAILKVTSYGSSIVQYISPFQTKFTVDKYVQFFVIAYGFIAANHWYNRFELIKFIFKNDSFSFDMSLIEPIVHLIVLPVGLFLFWKRKIQGWIMMVSYFLFCTVGAMGTVVVILRMDPTHSSILDSLFQLPSVPDQLFIVLFFVGSLWFLLKDEVKNYFRISKKTGLTTLSVSGIVSMLYVASYLLR